MDWVTGPIGDAASTILAAVTALYAILTGVYAMRGFRAHLTDRWSAAAATAVMGALAWLLAARGAQLLPAPFSVFLVIWLVGCVIFTLTYTLGRYRERIEKFNAQAGARLAAILQEIVPEERLAEWHRLRDRFRPTHEERRKAPHLMMGIFVAIYAALGLLVMRPIWKTVYGGVLAPGAGESIVNFYHATHSGFLVAGHMAGLTALLAILYLLAPTELLRLQFPELSYPFKSVILTRLREREKGLFGAHYYIASAAPLAALWLAADPNAAFAIMAVIAVTVFADAASALVGIRWGKTKWPHHRGKSLLGTLGGGLVAVAVCVPLVGVVMALVAGAVFALLDIFAPVPIPISDNILNPVGLAIAFTVGSAWISPLIPAY